VRRSAHRLEVLNDRVASDGLPVVVVQVAGSDQEAGPGLHEVDGSVVDRAD
jgi:hypothetical protein